MNPQYVLRDTSRIYSPALLFYKDLIRANIAREVDDFLAASNLARADIAHWIAHTGGPKVLRVLESELRLPDDALARSWRSLKNTGNLSSASVLFMLDEIMDSDDAKVGDHGLMIAMGPGFSVELVLFGW